MAASPLKRAEALTILYKYGMFKRAMSSEEFKKRFPIGPLPDKDKQSTFGKIRDKILGRMSAEEFEKRFLSKDKEKKSAMFKDAQARKEILKVCAALVKKAAAIRQRRGK